MRRHAGVICSQQAGLIDLNQRSESSSKRLRLRIPFHKQTGRTPLNEGIQAIMNTRWPSVGAKHIHDVVSVRGARTQEMALENTGRPPSNWRAGDYLGSLFGPYECLDCSGRHRLPGEGRALICPDLPEKEALTRATGYIELKLAKAKGQPTTAIEDLMLSDVAFNYWPRRYRWGRAIFDKYFAQLKPQRRDSAQDSADELAELMPCWVDKLAEHGSKARKRKPAEALPPG